MSRYFQFYYEHRKLLLSLALWLEKVVVLRVRRGSSPSGHNTWHFNCVCRESWSGIPPQFSLTQPPVCPVVVGDVTTGEVYTLTNHTGRTFNNVNSIRKPNDDPVTALEVAIYTYSLLSFPGNPLAITC